MPKIFSPAGDLGVRLRETIRSVERAFSDRRDAPVKLQQFATADLPDAAMYIHSVVADTDVDNLAFSDGSAWIYPLKATSVSAFGLTLIDDADAATARTTLGLGTAAVKNTGVSGDAVPVLNGAATTWAAGATFGGTVTGFEVIEASGDGFSSASGPAVRLTSTNANAGARNWLIVNSWDAFGDLAIRISNAKGGDPAVAANGTTIAWLTAASVDVAVPIGLKSYTVATVPSAAVAGRIIYVSNESGGATTAFSDGTNWRRHADRAVIS